MGEKRFLVYLLLYSIIESGIAVIFFSGGGAKYDTKDFILPRIL